MADSSSFMDWTPQTPEPAFNPYQGEYMPGGWPAQPPTPAYRTTGLFNPPRRRSRLEEVLAPVLPVAKRVCTGIFRTTIDATTIIVKMPAYAIVRQFTRAQERRRRTRPRQIRLPLPESPFKRALRDVPPRPDQPVSPVRFITVPGQEAPPLQTPHEQIQVQPRQQEVLNLIALYQPEQHIQHATRQEEKPHEVPEFRPARLLKQKKNHTLPKRYLTQQLSKNVFKATKSFTFAHNIKKVVPPTPEAKTAEPPSDAENVLLQTPYPRLNPTPAALSSPPSAVSSPLTDATATPSTQLQENLQTTTPSTKVQRAPNEVDSDEATVISSINESRKRRILRQGSRTTLENGTPTTKRVQTEGPSATSPRNPSIVLQSAAATTNVEDSATSIDTSLLTPTRFRPRKIITPKSQQTPKPATPRTPLSVISSTCNASPGNYHLDDLAPANTPEKSEISSFFAGSPRLDDLVAASKIEKNENSSFLAGSSTPIPQSKAAQLKMIITGGGTPTTESKTLTQAEQSHGTTEANANETQVQASGETTPSKTSTMEEKDKGKEHTAMDPTEATSNTTNEHNGLANQDAVPEAVDLTKDAEQKSDHKDNDTDMEQTSTDNTKQQATTAFSATNLPDENETGESSSSSTPTSSKTQTPEKQLAKLQLDDDKYTTPEQSTPKAHIHSVEKTTRKTRAEARREEAQQDKHKFKIVQLNKEQEATIDEALRKGNGKLDASDFGRVVSRTGSDRGTDQWLNDEVINAYLALIVKHGKQNDRPTQTPSYHAFSSFFMNTLESKGYDGVKRWASRAKINGKNLLETEAVFIPINSGAHWTLCVVSGKARTATHYNSLRGNAGRRFVAKIKEWLAAELGSNYKEDEWSFVEVGESPLQANMDDCGVFTITSARQIMLGLTPMSYRAEVIPLQRRRIVAELVAGALLKSSE